MSKQIEQAQAENKPKKKSHTGCLLLVIIVLLLIGACWAVGQMSPGTTTEPVSTGLEHRISSAHRTGCSDREYFVKLATYAAQKDVEAFELALGVGLATGTCTRFEQGEVVYITDSAILSGLVKVRRKGQTQEYWTVMEAVD